MTAAALGVDMGSHGIRVVVASGRTVLAEAAAVYPGALPPARRPLAVYEETLQRALRAIPVDVRSRVGGIAVAGIRGAVVVLDHNGGALSPVLPDFDGPSAASCAEVGAVLGATAVARTGCPAFPLSGLPKLKLLAELVSASDDAVMMGPQDAINLRLTGRWGLGVGVARRWGILAAERAELDDGLLSSLGIPRAFPALIAVDAVIGGLTAAAASSLGLPSGVPVVSAPGDTPVALRGLADSPDFAGRPVLVSLSTTTVTSTVADPGIAASLAPDLTYEVLRGDLDARGSRAIEGGDGSGMFQIDWLCRLLRCAPDQLDALAASAGDASGIVVDTPFMDVWGTGRSGSLTGLDRHSGAPELAAAVLDAIAAGAARMVERLARHARPDMVVLAGGGAASLTIRERLRERIGHPLVPLAGRQLAAAGAAVVAGRATDIPVEVAA